MKKDHRDEDVVTERASVVLSHGQVVPNAAVGRGHDMEQRYSDDGSRSNVDTRGLESSVAIDGSLPVAQPSIQVETKGHTDEEPITNQDQQMAEADDSVKDTNA